MPVKRKSQTWLSKISRVAIAEKRKNEGSPEYALLQKKCSEQIYSDYCAHVAKTKSQVGKTASCPKAWWKLSSRLMLNKKNDDSTPPLQNGDKWARTPKEKANALAKSFSDKYTLPIIEGNEYSCIVSAPDARQGGFFTSTHTQYQKDIEINGSREWQWP